MTQYHVLIHPTTTTAGFERHLMLLVQTVQVTVSFFCAFFTLLQFLLIASEFIQSRGLAAMAPLRSVLCQCVKNQVTIM